MPQTWVKPLPHTMKLLTSMFFFGWAVFGQTLGLAQPTPPIVLRSASQTIQLALEQNPDLRIYRLKRQQAALEHKLSKSFILPTITGSVGAQKNIHLPITPVPGEIFGQPGQTVQAQFGQQYNYNAGIAIQKNFLDWQAIVKSRVAKIQVEISEGEAGAFKQQLTEQVALYYYTVLITQKAAAIYDQDVKIADSTLLLIRQKFAQGLVNQLTVNRAKIHANNTRQNKQNNQRLFDQCTYQLKPLLGLSADAPLTIEEKAIHLPPALPTLQTDKALRVYALKRKQTAMNVKLHKASFTPRLSFYSYFGKQQFSNTDQVSFDNNAWSNYSYIGLNLSVPVFTGLSRLKQLKIAKISHESAQEVWQREQQKAANKDQWLLTNYQHYRTLAKTAHSTFKLTQSNVALAWQQYRQGLISLPQYFQVFDEYLQAESAYLNVLSKCYSNYATILSRK